MFLRILLVLVLLGALGGGLYYLKLRQIEEQQAQASPPPPPAVSVTEVRADSWERSLSAVGSLVASQGVWVASEVAGQVSALSFQSGQRIEAGAPLVELEASVDRADLDGLAAEARLAELEFARGRELLEQRSISRAEVDRLRAELEFKRARVEAQRARIRKKTLRAPFDGLLGIRQVDLGEYLAPGARVVLLQTLDPIFVDYTVPERHFDRLAPGQVVEIRVQTHTSAAFTGRIVALNPGIDPGTRSVRIRAEFDNPDGRLRPGMFAQVRTLLGSRDHVLTVPRTAITYAPYGDSVFVVSKKDAEAVVHRRQVRTGAVREGRVEIADGLEEGERVVETGQVKLRNDQPVRIAGAGG